MRPIEFKGCNKIYAKDQPEYLPLPVFDDGRAVVSCWEFTFFERLKILFGGKMWFTQLIFGEPLQPQRPSIECPLQYEPEDSNQS